MDLRRQVALTWHYPRSLLVKYRSPKVSGSWGDLRNGAEVIVLGHPKQGFCGFRAAAAWG